MRSFSYPSILRGARTVMSEHDAFDRVLALVHDATLDETRWPATSALIDEACGLTGNGLMVAEGPPNDVRALFVGLYARGQRRDDLEREYLTTYHPLDERVPRFRQLPARRLVHITALYTAEELKTSRTYNELLPRAGMQDSLNVRLPGLAGSHIGWGLNDPVDSEGWGSSRITMIQRLLPHIQQFVRVRQVLAGAGALGASLADLLATTRLGIIQLDGRGRIAAANDRALALLRTGDGLVDKDGVLCADVPADDAVLQGLLTRALPPFGGQGAGGSMMVRRAADPQPLLVHLMPIGRPEPAVRLEFVVRPPLGAGPSPGSGRPNGHCSVRHGPPCVRQRRSTACGPSTTRGCVPRCSRPESRQVLVQDHGHSRTAQGRDILAASCRSGAPRMGGTEAPEARS